MIDILIEMGICYEMEINVEKKTKVTISRESCHLQIMIDEKQLENAGYFNYLCGIITNSARFTREIKSRVTMTKYHSTGTRHFSPANCT
jgi:hypothetical protein